MRVGRGGEGGGDLLSTFTSILYKTAIDIIIFSYLSKECLSLAVQLEKCNCFA